MIMKKIILSFVILFLLTGCWDYNELNNYSIVSGVSIDKSGDEYEASVLISNSPMIFRMFVLKLINITILNYQPQKLLKVI